MRIRDYNKTARRVLTRLCEIGPVSSRETWESLDTNTLIVLRSSGDSEEYRQYWFFGFENNKAVLLDNDHLYFKDSDFRCFRASLDDIASSFKTVCVYPSW